MEQHMVGITAGMCEALNASELSGIMPGQESVVGFPGDQRLALHGQRDAAGEDVVQLNRRHQVGIASAGR